MERVKSFPTSKVTQVVLIIITWVAFLLRTINLTAQSLWRDEVDTILFSSTTWGDLLAHFFHTGHNGPLYFVLIRLWRSGAGDSEFAIRYPSAMFGTLAIPLGYILARDLGYSRRTGWIFGLLLATSPYLVWYGQEAKMYSLLVALIALAFIAYQRAVQTNQGTWWLIYVCSTTISFYIHILAPLMMAVYVNMALWNYPKIPWRNWFLSLACLTLPYLPLVVWQIDTLYNGFTSGHPFYSLSAQLTLLLQIYSHGLLPPTHPFTWLIFITLPGLSLTRPGQRVVLGLWLFWPTLLIHLISWRVALFEDRYLIYLTLPYYLSTARGLVILRQFAGRVALGCLAVALLSNFTTVWTQQHRPLKPDFRAAANHLKNSTHPPTTVMVQMPYLHHTLHYYYPRDQYKLLEGLWTNANQSPAEIAQHMTTLTRCLPDLWLVVSEEASWDSRGLVRAWLNSQATLIESAEFTRVSVYYYQFYPKPASVQINDRSIHQIYLPLIIYNNCQIEK